MLKLCTSCVNNINLKYFFVCNDDVSIGSLGSGKSKEFVSGITVNGAKFSGTTNGVRIKTWQVIFESWTLLIIFVLICLIIL